MRGEQETRRLLHKVVGADVFALPPAREQQLRADERPSDSRREQHDRAVSVAELLRVRFAKLARGAVRRKFKPLAAKSISTFHHLIQHFLDLPPR